MPELPAPELVPTTNLLALKGYDTRETILACYGGSGFTEALRASAADDDRILLVDLKHLYQVG